jgi:hypothetical protein
MESAFLDADSLSRGVNGKTFGSASRTCTNWRQIDVSNGRSLVSGTVEA